MKFRKLRDYCERLIEDMDIPHHATVEDFCALLADKRGRALYLHPMPHRPVAAIACGVWIGTANADHIFFEDNTSRFHRDHIILHEVGHILCDHRLTGSSSDDLVSLLVARFDQTLVERTLTRAGYTEEQEQVAEMVATLLREITAARAPHSPGVLGQWELGLGYRNVT